MQKLVPISYTVSLNANFYSLRNSFIREAECLILRQIFRSILEPNLIKSSTFTLLPLNFKRGLPNFYCLLEKDDTTPAEEILTK